MFHSPSIVPEETDVYLVLDDFGNRLGRICSETDEADTDCATLISYLLQGQYANPARIVVFNTVEGWSRDATGCGTSCRGTWAPGGHANSRSDSDSNASMPADTGVRRDCGRARRAL